MSAFGQIFKFVYFNEWLAVREGCHLILHPFLTVISKLAAEFSPFVMYYHVVMKNLGSKFVITIPTSAQLYPRIIKNLAFPVNLLHDPSLTLGLFKPSHLLFIVTFVC